MPSKGTCSIEGCAKTGVIRRGWCTSHYERWLRHGDPLANTTVERRFLAKVDRTGNGGCWLFTGFVAPNGYGQSQRKLAHRLSYELYVGPIPEGTEIDHLCRVRHCVNPAHLEAVSHYENNRRGVGISANNIRKTHCVNGHEFTPENTRMYRGWRTCRKCKAIREGVRRVAMGREAWATYMREYSAKKRLNK